MPREAPVITTTFCSKGMILPARMGRGFAPVAMVLSFITGSGGVQAEDRLGSPANPGRILKSGRRHVQIKLNAEVARSFKDISDRNWWRGCWSDRIVWSRNRGSL
jgi:hypothetical protein